MSLAQQYMNRIKQELCAMSIDDDDDGVEDTAATTFYAGLDWLANNALGSYSSGYDADETIIRTFTSGYGGNIQFILLILL